MPLAAVSPINSGISTIMASGDEFDGIYFAVTASGSLYGWGENYCCAVSGNYGIFGNNSTLGSSGTDDGYQYSAPYKIISSGVQSASITPYSETACAIVSGNLECWGENTYGEDGDGTIKDDLVPVFPQSLE